MVGKPAPAQLLVLKNKGCYHNGEPIWSFEDGYYDGDYDTQLLIWVDFIITIDLVVQFVQGQSHQLRWGGYGSTGKLGNLNSW